MARKPKPLNIFISWSGKRSRALAEALHDWLPKVIQVLQPWMSQSGIEKGDQWFSEISHSLDQAHIGLICLTPENVGHPWILFEAGAFFRRPLCTILLDIGAEDLPEPLKHYQATWLSRDDMLRLLGTCNRALSDLDSLALSELQLQDSFDNWWPQLATKIDAVLSMPREEVPAREPEDGLLARKILERMETISGLLDKAGSRGLLDTELSLTAVGDPQNGPPPPQAATSHLLDLGDKIVGDGLLSPDTSWRLAEVLLRIRDEHVDLKNDFAHLLAQHKE